MQRLFLLIALAGLVTACDPPTTDSPIKPPTEEPTPDNPEPEPEPKPGDTISTLEGDIEVMFPEECSLSYADCFGDYYSTGNYMWGFYFMNFTSKEQIYIEVMHPVHDLIIPEGTFTASSNISAENVFITGDYDSDGYLVYSWYIALETEDHPAAIAPIKEGTVTISANEDGTYRATFDLKDDAHNRITSTYDGRMVIEDLRI